MTKGYIKWSPAEWLRVGVALVPLLDEGKHSRFDALKRAMKAALPKDRWRDDHSLKLTAQPLATQIETYAAKARELPAEQRAALTTPKPERAASKPRAKYDDTGRDYGENGGTRWTQREKALLWRMVDWFKRNGAEEALPRLVIEAQELVLDRDRRRALAGIKQAHYAGTLEKDMAEGERSQITVAHIPFVPPHGPGSELADDARASEADEVLSMVTRSPQEPAAALMAPMPPPMNSERLQTALVSFADTMTGALASLLLAQRAEYAEELSTRMSVAASNIAAMVAATIERGLKSAVHQMVEQELGGQVKPPAMPPAPPVSPVVSTPDEYAKRLKVDVIGLQAGEPERTVRNALNGDVELRFFGTDSNYAPHRGRHIILMTARLPRTLQEKIKASGVEPQLVRPTTGHVIHAIEELVRTHTAQAQAVTQ